MSTTDTIADLGCCFAADAHVEVHHHGSGIEITVDHFGERRSVFLDGNTTRLLVAALVREFQPTTESLEAISPPPARRSER